MEAYSGFTLPQGVTIPEVVPLTEPEGGTPPLVSTPLALQRAADRLASQQGPVAIDTERASGIRYGQRAFLVQLKRGGSGVILIDPEALDDFSPLQEAIQEAEWVLHAATQDLPCLLDLGLKPSALFDTELAGRLAGLERVGLGHMVENLLGYQLAKEHSSADWSQRPLPESWLNYAALDVDILLELRQAVIDLLEEKGKLEFAAQEFDYLLAHPVKEARPDPWRKTKGIRELRNRLQMTALKNLWYEREHLAQTKDIAPKRLLPDSALIEAARTLPRSVPALLAIPGFQTRALRNQAPRWVRAIAQARREEPVPFTTPASGPPPLKAWEPKRPVSAQLLAESKLALAELSQEQNIPAENLLTPDSLRRLCWDPPAHNQVEALRASLLELGARKWQIELVAPVLAQVFETVRPQDKARL